LLLPRKRVMANEHAIQVLQGSLIELESDIYNASVQAENAHSQYETATRRLTGLEAKRSAIAATIKKLSDG
jgi:chromosome segregation ATPase